jgi:hypothetical protein
VPLPKQVTIARDAAFGEYFAAYTPGISRAAAVFDSPARQCRQASEEKLQSASADDTSFLTDPESAQHRKGAETCNLKLANSPSLPLCRDEELIRRDVILHAEHVRLAADLAVFHVPLPASRGFVDGSLVPLSAGCALKTGLHELRKILEDAINKTTKTPRLIP